MRAAAMWTLTGALVFGAAWIATHHPLLKIGFLFMTGLYCLTGVGPYIDKREALKMRKQK